MHPYPRTIVCPIFSEACLGATLRYAAFLATWSGARLLIVTMKDGPRSPEAPGEPEAQVQRLHAPDDAHFPELDEVIYERFELQGEPVSGLNDFVQNVDADLVVVGNDIGFEQGSALGRITQGIANCLECNVILIKQPDPQWADARPMELHWSAGWLSPSNN